MTWTEDRATQRCEGERRSRGRDRSRGRATPGPAPFLLRDWHESDRPSRHDAATVWQDALFNPLARTTRIPFHAEPGHAAILDRIGRLAVHPAACSSG
jgi:hypothetical protein